MSEECERGNAIAIVECQLSTLTAKFTKDDWLKTVIAYEVYV